MLFKWNYKPPTSDEKRVAKELGEKLNINQILAYLLIRRGITTESGAKRFFHPQLADLNNPFLMKDMDVAVDRLNDAMGRKERILVYGDYARPWRWYTDSCSSFIRISNITFLIVTTRDMA